MTKRFQKKPKKSPKPICVDVYLPCPLAMRQNSEIRRRHAHRHVLNSTLPQYFKPSSQNQLALCNISTFRSLSVKEPVLLCFGHNFFKFLSSQFKHNTQSLLYAMSLLHNCNILIILIAIVVFLQRSNSLINQQSPPTSSINLFVSNLHHFTSILLLYHRLLSTFPSLSIFPS